MTDHVSTSSDYVHAIESEVGDVPNLYNVIRELPNGLDPDGVKHMATRVHWSELKIDNMSRTIAEWLQRGGDPIDAVGLLALLVMDTTQE